MHVDDDVEEEFEIDINDEEPEFLKGQSAKSGVEVSPVKIVANPDGSLQVRHSICVCTCSSCTCRVMTSMRGSSVS